MYQKLFFQTIRLYYQEKEIKDDGPFLKVYFLHVLAFTMQLICLRYTLYSIFSEIPIYKIKVSQLEVIAIVTLALIIGYLLFLKNKKYLKIYAKYKTNPFYSTNLSKALIIGYFILSVLSPFIFTVVYNLIHYGKIAV